MKRSLTQGLAAALLGAFSLGAVASDLDTILEKNTQAHGGAAAHAAIESVRHHLSIKEPTFEVQGVYVATRDGRMRIDVHAGGERVFAEGLNETCAWEWTPGQPEEEGAPCVGETETTALRNGIELPGHFFTLEDVRRRGANVELIGEVEYDGASEWQVRVTLPAGSVRDYFIDTETWRLTRSRDRRAFHPGIDPTEVTIETRYFEPEMIDGVLRFRRQENTNIDTGDWLGTTRVDSIEYNIMIPEGFFEKSWSD